MTGVKEELRDSQVVGDIWGRQRGSEFHDYATGSETGKERWWWLEGKMSLARGFPPPILILGGPENSIDPVTRVYMLRNGQVNTVGIGNRMF